MDSWLKWILSLGLAVFVMACSVDKTGFLDRPEAAQEDGGGDTEDGDGTVTREAKLVISSGDTNTRSVVMYGVGGTFERVLANYRTHTALPRGLGFFDENRLLLSTDATDQIRNIIWDGEEEGSESLFAFSNLNGNVYDIESRKGSHVFVLDSNTIEVFDTEGGWIRTVPTTIGSCVLNNPRGMYLTEDDELIVTNQGGTDLILTYDVSNIALSNPTCSSAVVFGNNPYGVVKHSDGHLYIVTQGDDRVYQADADGSNAVVIFSTDITKISDPTAIVELPNGNLAVASSVTDEVWEMQTDGTLADSVPLIRDPLSLNITDMIVIPEYKYLKEDE